MEQGKEHARPGFANDVRDTVGVGGDDARPLGEILQTKREVSPTNFFNDPTIVSGKRTVQRDWVQPFLGSKKQVVQAKLQVGEPNDKFEQEADQVAEKVVQSKSMTAAPTPPPADEGTGIQPKRIAKKGIQRKSTAAAPSVPKPVEQGLESKKGKGDALPPETQEHMESTIGADFSGVRVHTDAESVQMSQNLNAQAFTHGNDIYFNQGKYNPGTTEGDRLLAHELTHTVQQGASTAVPGVQASVISDIVGLADTVGVNIPRIVDNIPGYTLFCYIIEYDILRDQRVEPDTRNLIRGLMGLIPFGNLAFEKLEEYGIIAKAVTWVDARVKALNLSTQRLLDAASSAWDEMSITKGIDGNLDVLRKHFLPILNDVKTFATDAGNEFLKLVKEALLKPLVAYLETNSPAYKLATKVLHRKFPLDDRVEASTEVILEDFLKLIGKTTEAEQMKAKGTLKKAADWIDTQLARFFSLLDRFKAIVNTIWEAFSLSTLQDIPKVFKKVWDDFTTLLKDFLAFAAEVALKILELVKDALLSALASHVDKVPGFHLLTVILGKNPFTQAPVPRTTENLIRGFMGLVPGGEAKFQELKESGVVPRAAARIDALVARLGISWAMIVDTFKGIWKSLSINDLVNPIAAFQRIAAAFGTPVAKIFTFVVEVVKILVELVLAMMNFPSNLVTQIIANVMAAFEKIKRDPVAFLMNLLRAVKKGFEQFFGNFLKHLLKGLQTWLFGELGTAGITPPPDITFKSVLSLAMQVLGITVDNILDRLALKIGKEKVEKFKRVMHTLTGVWAFIKDVIERGPIAIWEYIQQKISNLWDTVVNGIKEWIMGRIIAAVTTKLLSLLDPTGIMPVINSFIAFFRAVQSFLDKLREMLEIVNTFTKGVLDIANGNLTKAADYLEKALADGVPVAIAFLANQVGLGKLGEKIKEMIGLAREKINEGIDWLIDKALAAGRAILDAIMGRGQQPAGQPQAPGQSPTTTPSYPIILPDNSRHTLTIEMVDGKKQVVMRSVPVNVKQFLETKKAATTDPTVQGDATAGITATGQIETQAASFANDPHYDPSNLNAIFQNVATAINKLYASGQVGAPDGTINSPYWIIWHKTYTTLYPPINIVSSPGGGFTSISASQRTKVDIEFIDDESGAKSMLRVANQKHKDALAKLVQAEKEIENRVPNWSTLSSSAIEKLTVASINQEIMDWQAEITSLDNALNNFNTAPIAGYKNKTAYRKVVTSDKGRITTIIKRLGELQTTIASWALGDLHKGVDDAKAEIQKANDYIDECFKKMLIRSFTIGVSPKYHVFENSILGPTKTGRVDANKDEMRDKVLPAAGLDPSGGSLQVDHAVDQSFGGPDEYENLWPVPPILNPVPPRYIDKNTGKEDGQFGNPPAAKPADKIDLAKDHGKYLIVKGKRN